MLLGEWFSIMFWMGLCLDILVDFLMFEEVVFEGDFGVFWGRWWWGEGMGGLIGMRGKCCWCIGWGLIIFSFFCLGFGIMGGLLFLFLEREILDYCGWFVIKDGG